MKKKKIEKAFSVDKNILSEKGMKNTIDVFNQ